MTLSELRELIGRRQRDAEAMHATAAVGDVLAVVLAELADLQLEDVPEVADRLVDVEYMADLMGVGVDYLYANRKKLPFARKLSRKCLRFSLSGYSKWLRRKGPPF